MGEEEEIVIELGLLIFFSLARFSWPVRGQWGGEGGGGQRKYYFLS